MTVQKDSDARRDTLDLRLDLANHSPTGFAWGYFGSGPAQLALAICADALGDDQRALGVYQSFKSLCIAKLPQNVGWKMSEEQVLAVIQNIERMQVQPREQPADRQRLD